MFHCIRKAFYTQSESAENITLKAISVFLKKQINFPTSTLKLHEPSCALTALCQCAFPQEACGMWSNVTRDGPRQNARWNIGKYCLAKGWNIQGIYTNKWRLKHLKKVVTHT